MADDKYSLMKLKGSENWADYKYQVSADLMGKNIWDVITGDLKEPDALAAGADANAKKTYDEKVLKFKNANNQAIAVISRTLSPAVMKIARTQGHNAKAVWDRFEALYEAKMEHRAERLYYEFSSIKINQGERVTDYMMCVAEA